MSSKLPSQSFSSESLVKGMKAVANQQVKAEPEVKEMEAELQELMRQRAMLSPVPAGGGLTKENPGGASSAAYPTQHSTTTPGKTLKKSRVEISKSNSTAQITFDETIPGDISPPGSPLAPRALDLGQTGDSPDEIEVLREEYHKVVNRNADLEVQVKMLQDELTQMKISAPGCNDTENNEGTGEQGNPEVPASEEAARKRLQRICTPKADGNLLVPREIYEEWRKGGASRARLQETFANLNFDKAAFIAHVTLEIEERQSMKTTVHAEWASEEKMRDGMHMSAARIKAVKDYCEKHEGLTKFDKYEGKMLFWVEHEVTAQYESSKTRTRREQVNFDTDEPDSTLCAASAPMTLNMDDVRNMSLGGTPGAGGDVQPQPCSQPPVLPQLQKNEKPSQQILKYMEGINKRVTKTMELKGKYEAIDEVSRSTAQKAFVQKLTQLVDALENKQALINEVYSSGAVEGYTDEQETVLRDHYKEAMKVAQESVTMEARARSIPAKPKAVAAPASKAKAKAKVKAKAKASAKAEASPKAAPKRAARC